MTLDYIFFDLDGTLLPMDQEAFVQSYFHKLAQMGVARGYDPEALVQAVAAGTDAMLRNDGAATNEAVFWRCFEKKFGVLTQAEQLAFDAFYREEFQTLAADCGKNPAAADTVQRLLAAGYRLVLATNPVFPAIATESRVRWAGLEPEQFVLRTTYENSCFCKPNPAYYQALLAQLGCRPERCLMVGNDVAEDMVASTVGMQVFLLTDCLINRRGADISRFPQGGFQALLRQIGTLTENPGLAGH